MSARPATHPQAGWHREVASLGMWVFLATEAMFFGPLFMGYVHERLQSAGGFAVASGLTHLELGTLNTAILLTSSFAMAMGVRFAALEERRALRRCLAATALLGLAFLVVKGTEYVLEWRDGLAPVLHFTYAGAHGPAVEAFFFLYFLMTGVHAIHLTIGIGLVAWLAHRAHVAPLYASGRNAVEMVGLYWHFVDVVWVFLYPMFYLIERYR